MKEDLVHPEPGLQLWTTKVNKFDISGTRFFGKNLTTDLKPDRQKEFKNDVFILFPRLFGCAKFLSKFFLTISAIYIWDLGFGNPSNRDCRVHQDINGHHDCLIDRPVLLLLAHSPCSSSTCQTLTVSAHKLP
jgi:hypothetical protein